MIETYALLGRFSLYFFEFRSSFCEKAEIPCLSVARPQIWQSNLFAHFLPTLHDFAPIHDGNHHATAD